MSHWLRPRLILFLAVPLALVMLAAGAGLYLLRPESFTSMLQRQAQKAGLELHLTQPASPSLFPRPSLQLEGLTLNAVGASSSILNANEAHLVLPWSALLGGKTAISQLRIDEPRVDLDALQAWLADLPRDAHPLQAQLPRIDTGIHISHGIVVRGNTLLLHDLTLKTGSLAPNEVFTITLQAIEAGGNRMSVDLALTPQDRHTVLQLNPIKLDFTRGTDTRLHLAGAASWNGGRDASLHLSGTLKQSDQGSDNMTAEAGQQVYLIKVRLAPGSATAPMLLQADLNGPATHANLSLPPFQLIDWWTNLNSSTVAGLREPPAKADIRMQHLDIAGAHIEGLQISADDTLPAANVRSAPAASSSSTL